MATVLCAGASAALAQVDVSPHPVDKILKALDLKADPGKPADFVEQSRPKSEPDFVPLTPTQPTRPVKVKTPAELKAMEAELDAARIQHDKISGRKPPPAKPARKADANSKPQTPTATQN